MSRLLESIKYENGQLHNLSYHEARMRNALKSVFKKNRTFNLSKTIPIPKGLKKARYKCRIVYDTEIREINFTEYKRKKIKKLNLVVDDKISYRHKFEERSCILVHTEKQKADTEILIVKNGFLRDASYSNIALFNGTEWHTPSYPLLKGTKRAELLDKGVLISKMLRPDDIKNYERISFINALNDLDELSLKL